MLMILAQLACSESFWAVAKVRSPHTGPGIRYIIEPRQPAPATSALLGYRRRHLARTCPGGRQANVVFKEVAPFTWMWIYMIAHRSSGVARDM